MNDDELLAEARKVAKEFSREGTVLDGIVNARRTNTSPTYDGAKIRAAFTRDLPRMDVEFDKVAKSFKKS
jgi:hypothetical protein